MSITTDFESKMVPVASHRFYNIGDVHQLLAYARNLEAQNGELRAMLRKLSQEYTFGGGLGRQLAKLLEGV